MTDLHDAAAGLSTWLAQVLPGIEDAFAEIDAARWTPGTKLAVQRVLSVELVTEFIECGPIFNARTTEQLDQDARYHLARFLVARARRKHVAGIEALDEAVKADDG